MSGPARTPPERPKPVPFAAVATSAEQAYDLVILPFHSPEIRFPGLEVTGKHGQNATNCPPQPQAKDNLGANCSLCKTS